MINNHLVNPGNISIRAHDISLSTENASVPEFDLLSILGMSVRLALHLRGVPAVSYHLIRQVAIYLLDIPGTAVRPVLEFLQEVEFIRIINEGRTIKTIIPNIPYYSDIFEKLGALAEDSKFNEPELLTIELIDRLSESPIILSQAYELGADKTLTNRVIEIGNQGGFITTTRARGRDVLLSPTYFPENNKAYAELTTSCSSGRVKRVLELLKNCQGWPLKIIEDTNKIGEESIDANDLAVIKKLAGEGFLPPPAIQTSHSGLNHFIFGPRPGLGRINPTDRPVYESAMALIAAVRQGQLLPEKYRIRYPLAILQSLKDKGFLRANTEAFEQYHQVQKLRVGRLEETRPGWWQLSLIDRPENEKALDMAIELLEGDPYTPKPNEDISIAMKQGEKYIESLVARKKIKETSKIPLDKAIQLSLDDLLLQGRIDEKK